MKVVQEPGWLAFIDWYYVQHVPFYDIAYSPINYVENEKTTYVTLMLTLKHGMRWNTDSSGYAIPKNVIEALVKLDEAWSFKVSGSTKIMLTGKFKGLVDKFHNIPSMVVRKLKQ